MAIRTKEEILESIRTRIGDDTSDEALALVEDVSDTMDSLSNAESEDWKSKYEENDAAWRQKYRDRFYNTGKEDEDKDDDTPRQIRTFEDLFKKED